MADESGADDGAIFALWARLSEAQVHGLTDDVVRISEALARLSPGDPVPVTIRAIAQRIRDNGWGYLPVVERALA
jgi:hypothetical protein